MTNQHSRNTEISSLLYRRRYLVPNLFTIGNIFCGFLAIIYSSQGRFEPAVIAIFIGLILDGLDGRVARKLQAESSFGVQIDSLSDLVTFGVAPAFMAYHWYFFQYADQFGVLICFIYVVCAAARLARFNVTKDTGHDFSGLPTPAAAALIVSTINLFPEIDLPEFSVSLASVYVVTVSALMVSNIVYFSGKNSGNKFKLKDPLKLTIACAIAIAFFWYTPRITVFCIAMLYCASGPLMAFPATRNCLDRLFHKINLSGK